MTPRERSESCPFIYPETGPEYAYSNRGITLLPLQSALIALSQPLSHFLVIYGNPIAAPSEVPAGAALVGRAVLYQWPTEGWVRGTVARRCRAAGFSHVVRYGRTSPLGSVVTPSLLYAASHGPIGRWVLLVCLRTSRALL